MKLLIIKGYVIPQVVPENSQGELHEADIDELQMLMGAAHSATPQFFNVKEGAFVSITSEAFTELCNAMQDHPAIAAVNVAAEAYEAEKARAKDDASKAYTDRMKEFAAKSRKAK